MAYNRKHWGFVADIIREQRGRDMFNGHTGTLDALVWRFADKFKADNPAFDADKFFNATVEPTTRIRSAKV